MRIAITILSLLSLAFYSCSTEKADEIGSLPDYELVIVDSIQVDYMGSLALLDVNVEKGLFLFASDNDNHLLLTNTLGEIIKTYEEPGDSPTAVGSNVGAGTFLRDEIVIMGRNKLAVYDLNFNFQYGFKISYPTSGMFYMGFDHLKPAIQNGKPKLIAFTGGAQIESAPNQPEYYSNYNTFDLIDADSGSFSPIVPFHPQSRYLSGEAFNFIAPIFQVNGNEVSFVHKGDTLLYRYDLNQPNTFTAMRIPFDKFIMKKGFPLNSQEDYETPSDREGVIQAFYKVRDLNLITYTSGIKLEDMPDKSLEGDFLKKEFMRINPHKWFVMNDSGLSSKPQVIPNEYFLSRIDTDGNLWAIQNTYILDEEPDVMTFYKLQLVQK